MRHKLLLALVLLIGITTVTPQTSKPEDKSPHTVGFVTVNGVKLHYLDWGGTGDSLLFIAGSGDNAHTFDEIAPKFIDHFRVLALTRRGYGESDKPLTGYDVPNLANDVREFLDAMKIKRVNLVGHSAGGNELLQFASVYPQRTIKLVFLDAAYDRREIASLEDQNPLPDPEPANSGSAMSLKDKIQAEYFKHMDEFGPDYKKIKAPALSFYAIFETHWGVKSEADETTRKKAQEFIDKVVQPYQFRNVDRFRKEVVNGRVVVLRDTDHYFFKDPKRKDEVVREMRSFLLGSSY